MLQDHRSHDLHRHPEKVRDMRNLKGGKALNHMAIWGKGVPWAEQTVSAKALKQVTARSV